MHIWVAIDVFHFWPNLNPCQQAHMHTVHLLIYKVQTSPPHRDRCKHQCWPNALPVNMIIAPLCNRAQNNLDITLMPEGPRGMPSRTKGGPLTCLTHPRYNYGCLSLFLSEFPLRAPVIICDIWVFFLQASYPLWTWVLHGWKWSYE